MKNSPFVALVFPFSGFQGAGIHRSLWVPIKNQYNQFIYERYTMKKIHCLLELPMIKIESKQATDCLLSYIPQPVSSSAGGAESCFFI